MRWVWHETISMSRCRYSWYHVWVFLLTFYSYALYHVIRKSFSNVKSTMEVALSPSNHSKYPNLHPFHIWDSRQFFTSPDNAGLTFGYIDTTLLLCYSIGLFLSGWIADRVNHRYLLTGGMVLSALLTFLFGSVGPWLEIYNIYYYAVIWGLNGFAQSSGWPVVIAVMENWFGKTSRGFIFGVWSANPSVGNILSAVLVSSLLPYGFELAMMASSFFMFLGAIIVFFCLPEHPEKVGVQVLDDNMYMSKHQQSSHDPVSDSKTTKATNPIFVEMSNVVEASVSLTKRGSYILATEEGDVLQSGADGVAKAINEDSSHDEVGKIDSNDKQKRKPINFFRAFLLPGVIVYSLSYACVKLVNYGLFFWLPYYLNQRYSWSSPSQASRLSILYDVGGIIGGAIGGFVSDRLAGGRSPVVVVMLVLGIAALFVYEGFGTTPLLNGLFMCVAGIFIGGPAQLESSAISADLGKHPAIKGDMDALATVTGIVDGTGSFGAAIGQILIAVIEQKTNSWTWVFYFLMVMLAGSALLLSKLFVVDILSLWRNFSAKLNKRTNQ